MPLEDPLNRRESPAPSNRTPLAMTQRRSSPVKGSVEWPGASVGCVVGVVEVFGFGVGSEGADSFEGAVPLWGVVVVVVVVVGGGGVWL
jgi:hypothetical protein